MDPPMIPMTPYIHHTAGTYVGVTVPFLAIVLVVIIARFKVRPAWRFGWDDGFAIVGTILAITIWAILLSAVSYCVGKCPTAVPLPILGEAYKASVITIPLWVCAVASIKLSAICMLLRIQQSMRWKIFLYSMAAIQVGFVVGNLVWLLGFWCRPFSAAYSQNPADTSKCYPARATRIASNTSTYINLSTDIILSLVPLTFIVNLKRSFQERILICILMATGMLASAASIGKMIQFRVYNGARAKAPDAQIGMSSLIAMWSVLEMFLGIIATCLPYLKSWIQSVLVQIGFLSGASRAPPVLDLREITVTNHGREGSKSNIETTESKLQKGFSGSVGTSRSGTTTASCLEKPVV